MQVSTQERTFKATPETTVQTFANLLAAGKWRLVEAINGKYVEANWTDGAGGVPTYVCIARAHAIDAETCKLVLTIVGTLETNAPDKGLSIGVDLFYSLAYALEGDVSQLAWNDLLAEAEAAQNDGEVSKAENYFRAATEAAQKEFGHYHSNIAKCLLAYGLFLERQGRLAEALMRCKLAMSMYKQEKQTGALSFAANNVQRIEQAIEAESKK